MRATFLAALVTLLAAMPAVALMFEGNGVALEVSDGTPLGIVAVHRGSDGPALFVSPDDVEVTWELVLITPEGKEEKVDPVSAKAGGTAQIEGGKLVMTWEPVQVPTGTVTVSCRFEADRDQPLLYANISVVNDSRCAIPEVQFPRMTLTAQPTPADDITLVFPRAYGRSWRNPFDAPAGYLVGTQEPAGFTGGMGMQFGTIYDEQGNGLYWATYDGEGYHKRFVYDNRRPQDKIALKLCYVPENCLTPGIDFQSPYPTVLGAYTGDWWDAARMYRTWALQQKWCARGPVRDRDDVPQWIKDCDVWLRGDARRYTAQLEYDYARDLQDFVGGSMGVQLYSWYQPEVNKPNWGATLGWPMVEGYPEMVAQAADRGIHHTPYVNSLQTDTTALSYPPEAKAAALLGRDGNPCREGTEEQNEYICAATDVWKQMLAQACERLVRDGNCSGVYLDQLGGQCGRPCYSSQHGHPVGGGKYATDGLREICASCREAMWQHRPGAALSGEVQQETLLDVTDHRLQHYNIWPGWVPLWAAVYGDMSITYGRTIVWNYAEPDIGFFARTGNTLVSGMQFGRIWPTGNPKNVLTAPECKVFADYFKACVDLRRAAKDYLEFGYLQRPIKYLTEIPDLPIKDPKGRDSTIKAVLGSAWINPEDDSLAFVFTNISEDEQQFTWRADLSRYEIPDAEVYNVRQLKTDGSTMSVATLETTVLERRETMPAHSVNAYVVTVGAY